MSVFRCQEITEDSAQKTDDAFLSSVIYFLTPDTRNLKPKIGMRFVNYLRGATLEIDSKAVWIGYIKPHVASHQPELPIGHLDTILHSAAFC